MSILESQSASKLIQRRYAAYEAQIEELKTLLLEARSLFKLTVEYSKPSIPIIEKRDRFNEIMAIMNKIDTLTGMTPEQAEAEMLKRMEKEKKKKQAPAEKFKQVKVI